MDDPVLRMSFDDGAALVREFEQNLRHGRAYIQGPSEISVLSDVELVVVHPDDGAELSLRAQAVMVSPAGVGIELRPFDDSIALDMQAFVEGERAPETPPPEAPLHDAPIAEENGADVRLEAAAPLESSPAAAVADALPSEAPPSDASFDSEDDGKVPSLPPGDGAVPSGAPAATEPSENSSDAELPDADAGSDAVPSMRPSGPAPTSPPEEPSGHGAGQDGPARQDNAGADSEAPDGPETERQAGPSRQERLRKLSQIEQQKIARSGELNDRVMLERLYGKHVWDGLLRNPRLTIPEVARIARKGTVPRPLLELIVDNNGWIQAATVRRALLSNPRVNGEAVMKLMRVTPKHELRTISRSTAYSVMVRDAAKKILDR